MNAKGEIQLVIPMAGLGTRFADRGYETPKPLLDVHGLAMYRLVLANLLTEQIGRVAIIAQQAWQLSDSISELRHALQLEIELIEIDYITGGPADTVQLTEAWLYSDKPVVTANSDQYIDADIHSFYSVLGSGKVTGALLLMEDDSPKWSYARLDDQGDVLEVREKTVISRFATVGIYGFRSAEIMFDGFAAMRREGDRVNREFYVGPSYNYLLDRSMPVTSTNLGPVSTVMYGLGTPEDFEFFIASDVSRRAVADATKRGVPR